MGKPISLFSGYSQKENRTTNYCLLVLRMIYEENPKYLAEVLGQILGFDMSLEVGVRFSQQERKTSSVPDGLITQKPFTIYIETKNFDWFYDDQLEKHMEALYSEAQGLRVLIALGKFENDDVERFGDIRRLCVSKFREKVRFAAISFEELVSALKEIHVPKNLADAIEEFRSYLDDEDLLPSWQYRLDVINCVGLPDDILIGQAYMCPAAGGAYNHQRSKYFGMYRDKKVEKVALIRAVVDVVEEGLAHLRWRNVKSKKEVLKAEGIEKVAKFRGEYPTRVFLLEDLFDTSFLKDTRGGMQGSKQYFDVSVLGVKNAEELSNKLKHMTWTSYPGPRQL